MNNSNPPTLPLPSSPLPPHPNQTGAGERLKAFLQQRLPALLQAMTSGKSMPIQARAAAGFLPQALQSVEFDDATAVQILETLDDLNAQAWEEVLGEGGEISDE